MKKTFSLLLLITFLLLMCLPTAQEASAKEYPMEIDAKSCILMDAETGTVLFEANADAALPPASVTKIMTLLLVAEAIDSGKVCLTDPVSVSAEAAAMGGSQVFLEAGECLTVEELIKCVVIASANDAAYALAEHVAGSESAFVTRMNARAAELGMENTHFENTNGLDDSVTNHLTSARDIAIMSRALISHDWIFHYTTIWQDSIRGGSFTLTNTNRLVRFYPGATGLKTGSTSKALYCMSATAKRDGMHLIAVVMGAPTRDIRNAEAKKLLDYGFANYSLYTAKEEALPRLSVLGGGGKDIALSQKPFSALLKKGEEKRVEAKVVLPKSVSAPVAVGDPVGYIEYSVDGNTVGKTDIVATEGLARITFAELLSGLVRSMLGCFG